MASRLALPLGFVALSALLVTAVACGGSGSRARSNIVIRLIAFKPATLKVSTGATARWSQQDAGLHTVTSGTAEVDASGHITTKPDGKFASGKLAKGTTFSFTFADAGTYPYFCEIHPATMRGEIKVG